MIPDAVWAGIGAILAAVAFAIKRIVSKVPSAEEQSRAALLKGVEQIHRLIRVLARGIEDLKRREPCAWGGERLPPQYARAVEAAVERILAARNPGQRPPRGGP